MIQRIQSLWLLLETVLMALMLFVPIGWIVAGAEEYKLIASGLGTATSDGVITVASTIGLAIIIGAAALLPLVIIFLFKNRMVQFRLCMAQFALLLGAQVMSLLFLYRLAGIFSGELGMETSTSFGVAMFFPLIGMILNWMALRGIKKDIVLIKSLDRIR